ncbi:MAG: hypothetical protein KA335_02575 [Ramlibacter sp.]|jgi:hypothetical protein|nr:hypothetical protein [Ramlibacter sp.]
MRTLLALSLAVLAATPALAGRPLTVDDASVNDAGAGHVEAWYARQPGRLHTWTVAPAYAPVNGLELGAAFTRDRTTPQSSAAVQAKWRITPVQDDGCNAGAVLGVAQARGAGRTPYINGLFTCNSAWGATHFNLGANRARGGPTLGAWGVAHEREFGAITAHVEAFGQRLAKPTFQIGARKDIAKGLQLDGTLGRSNRETLVSVGLKVGF